MRVIFIGASSLTQMTAQMLIRRNHDVVIVERDKDKIEDISKDIDCGFIHGDGTRPDVLRELDPTAAEILFCFMGNDQSNLIAALVGRSLGCKRVFPKIDDPDFEHVAIELGLQDVILPNRTTGRYLADLIEGQDMLSLSAMIKGEARVTSFVVQAGLTGPLRDLGLPAASRVICLYRAGELLLVDDNPQLEIDDEVILITYQKHLESLHAQLTKRRESVT